MKNNIIPELPRKAWLILSADAVSALGNGLIIPFIVIYLRDVRGFRIEHVGLILSTQAVAGLVGAPLAGWLVDRIGARRALMLGLCTAGVASCSAIFVDHLWEGFAWAALFGIGISGMWPAAHSFMAGIVSPQQRAGIFSVHFALLNAGIGLGAVLGGLIADIDRPITFAVIFVLDAATFFFYVLVLTRVAPKDVMTVPAATEEGGGAWSRVWADKVFMRICVLGVLLVTLGYAQLGSSFPAFATDDGGLSPRGLGTVFAVNTIVIVAMQLLVLDRLSGKRKTRAIVAVCILWSASWVVTLIAGGADGGLLALLLFMSAAGIFALGETFMQAGLPALVNDLAPDDIRGRYNAAYSLTWSTGNIVGPAVAGFMLGAGYSKELFIGLAVACLATSFYAVGLERFIPAKANTFADKGEAG